jgi:enoyl-CoA hydratase
MSHLLLTGPRLEAPSLQAALQVENRSQILSSNSGELKEATADFATRKDR